VRIGGAVERKRSRRWPAAPPGTTTSNGRGPAISAVAAFLAREEVTGASDVGGDRGPERVGTAEHGLAAEPLDHAHGHPGAVDVAVEVEEMDLDRPAASA